MELGRAADRPEAARLSMAVGLDYHLYSRGEV